MSSSGRRPRRQDAEDDSLSSIAREAEARLAAKRAARAEAREIRLKELEKQQQEWDDIESQNGDIKHCQESNGSLPPVRSAVNTRPVETDYSTSNGGSNGRVRVEDSSSALEEKYKKAMVQNATLDNEKTTISYENQHLRNLLEEREDDLANSIKELQEKCQEAQRLKTFNEAQTHKLEQMKDVIKQKDQIIQDGGLMPENDSSELEQLRIENESLKTKLMEEQSKSVAATNDEEFQVKEKLYQDTKQRAQKAEQEIEAQKAYIARLEGQVSRYKAAADHYESAEDDLKTEKRRLQREIRALQDKNEELELTKEHLEKRLEKIRQARLKP